MSIFAGSEKQMAWHEKPLFHSHVVLRITKSVLPFTFLKCVGILTKCVPILSVNLESFIIKKTKSRILSKSSPAEIKLLPAMAAFKEVI